MKLTPIKIRGKRRRGAKNEGTSLSKELPAPPPKRQKLRMKAKRVPPVPPIHRLPTEILERILVFSQNPSFARVTPSIGVMLSGKKTLMEFVIAAFAPTWDAWFGQELGEIESYTGFLEDPARIAGDPVFQTAVLGCPWATCNLILDAQQLWLTRATRRPSGSTPPSMAEEYFTNQYSNLKVAEAFEVHLQRFREKPAENAMMSMIFNAQRKPKYHIKVHPQTTIPDTLFLAPFTHAKTELLFWLVTGNAKLQSSQTWELTLHGFRDLWAMSTDPRLKLMLIDLFVRLDVFVQWPFSVREETRAMMEKPGAFENPGDAMFESLERIRKHLMFPELVNRI